ncbi:MAG TPA: M56 family metallopeptidase [Chitinophagaceae bacterium]|nr:M56 family metallopeptidase [Chitinophagaceae bacterium]
MQELYRSDLLQALGWAIADSLWQMSLLWLVYQVFIVLPFRQKPVIKHSGAVLLLMSGTIWFFYSFFTRFAKEKMAEETVGNISPAFSFSITNLLTSTLPYLSSAYLVIVVLLFARLVYNFISTQKLKMELKPAIEWQHVVNRLTVSMGISREIFIYISEYINVPSTIGYLKPVILLPIATVNQLSVEQLEAVIIHEMAHIRRNDYLVNLAVAFIETILFFNPFAHLLGRAIRKECELCCDDAVVRQQDPQAYAQALLLLEQSKLQPALAMAVTGRQGMLLGRVKRILNVPDQEVKYRHKVLALVLLAGFIMLTGLLTPARVSEQDREKTNSIAQQVALEETDRAPLPFVMKLSYPEKAPAVEKTVPKISKPKIQSPRNFERTIADDNNSELLFAPETPVAPVPPPAPPVTELTSEGFNFALQFPEAEDLLKTAGAPDPRDRRHPDILRNEKFRKEQEFSRTKDAYRVVQDNARQFQDLAKLKGNIANISAHPEQIYTEKVLEDMVENMITAQGQAITPRIQYERKKVSGTKIARPVIKAIPADNGMTITIIRNEEQIEITVKDKR